MSHRRILIALIVVGMLIAAWLTLSASSEHADVILTAQSATSPVVIPAFDDPLLNFIQIPPPTTTTTARPVTTTAPKQPAASSSAGDPYDDASWDRLAQCESTGNWQANTGNGYYGGIQFSLSSWRSVGGTGYPHEHPRAEQIARGKLLWEVQGWGAWPACTRSFGWR